ncbi:hypothetical protein ABPG74_013641 [Tetrahymena malaccensis]
MSQQGTQQESKQENQQSKFSKIETTSEQFEDQIRKNKAKLSENDRIKILVVRVCEDSPKTFVLSIRKLADQIIEYAQKPEKVEYKDVLIRYFVDSVSLLSFKQAVYATVLSLVFLKSKGIFDELLKKITDQFQKSLDNGERIKSKNILIFLGELMNIGVVNGFNYRQLVVQILDQCKQLENQEEREYYLSIVVGSLGYVQEYLMKKMGHEYEQIIKEIQILMKKRDTSYIQIFKNKYNKDKDQDRLQVLWQSILRDLEKSKKHSSSSNETVDVNQDQHPSLKKPYLQFSNDLKNIEQPEFSFIVEFKNRNSSKCIYQSPLFSSTILKYDEEIERLREEEEQQRADEEGEEEEEIEEEQDEEEDYDDEEEDGGRGQKPKKSKKSNQGNSKKSTKKKSPRKLYGITTERVIFHENSLQTIQLFRQSKKNLFEQIKMLIRMCGEETQSQKQEAEFIFASFVDLLFVESVRSKNGTLEDQIASRVLYFSSLSNTLHSLKKDESADIIYDAFSEFYRNLSEYTADSVENLAEFISHVLSETHLSFPWERITLAVSKQEIGSSVNPQVLLWRDIIYKLCLLCGREKVENALKGSNGQNETPTNILLSFLTPIQVKEIIKTQYQQDPLAQRFMELLVQKKTHEEMGEEINEALKEGIDDEGEDENEKKHFVISVFLECLFFRSCETFTHLKILYDRYAPLLKKLLEEHGEVFQNSLVNTLLLFWQNNSSNLEHYLKKFISNNFITPQVVASSIFEHLKDLQASPASIRQVHQLWLFLRRMTFNIFDTFHNYTEEVNSNIHQGQEEEEKAGEIETLSQKLEKAKQQLTELLEIVFSQFESIFSEVAADEIKDKQYDTYFLYFYRKYKKFVDWENTYQQQFSSFKTIPQNVIQSYRI